MDKRYLLDTNIAIYFLQGRLNPFATTIIENILRAKTNISIITKIELLSWPEDEELSKDFVNNSNIFSIIDSVVELCIEIREIYKTKLPDALIAATSISNNLTLVTRNSSDFKRIRNLSWINPFDPQ